MRKLRAVSITEDKKRVQRNCALYFLTTQGRAARMARVAGFEPANDGVRIRCLTAWRYPNSFTIISQLPQNVKWFTSVAKQFVYRKCDHCAKRGKNHAPKKRAYKLSATLHKLAFKRLALLL